MPIEPSTNAAVLRPTRHLFDVCIDALTIEQVTDAAEQAIEKRTRLLIAVVNAAKMVNMRTDEGLRRAVLGADMILADGMSVVWASRLLGAPLPERVAGIDLLESLLQRCNERGYRVFLLGATDEVLARVRECVTTQYPNVVLAGARNGYFDVSDEEQIARQIAATQPDVLFVGISSPKKERFLAHWATALNVPVCHGVGGAFDVMAGQTRRAPEGWQRLGLEWAYRLFQEPRRLWKRYMVTNTVFSCMVLRAMLSRLRPARSADGSKHLRKAHSR